MNDSFKLKVLEWLIGDSKSNKELNGKQEMIVDNNKGHDYDDYLGQNVFIRTVTNFYTGKVEKTTKTTMTLSTAAWIADTGRFNEAVKTGVFAEVEPYKEDIKVNLGSFEDISVIPVLPTEVK